MIEKIGSVGVGFQKVVTGIYAGYVFLESARAMDKTNSSDFGMKVLCRKLLKTQRACFSEM